MARGRSAWATNPNACTPESVRLDEIKPDAPGAQRAKAAST
jgi:hypothetical protein